jgi:hypothetical protein
VTLRVQDELLHTAHACAEVRGKYRTSLRLAPGVDSETRNTNGMRYKCTVATLLIVGFSGFSRMNSIKFDIMK